MCGRFVSASPPEEIAEYFGAVLSDVVASDPVVASHEPRYNVAPTDDVFVVFVEEQQRRLDLYRWGLVPYGAADLSVGNRMINARAETLASKGVFRASLTKRRCIVPADGFYEWKVVGGTASKPRKQPYFIRPADGGQLAFAGLWSEWHGEVAGERSVVRSTTIITTEANDAMSALHHRMPVILPPDAWDEWLDPERRDVEDLERLLVPADGAVLAMHPVSPAVGNVRNDGPELIEEVDPDEGDAGGGGGGDQLTLL